jgi:GMP synthase-like glutamine amidotransferase
MFRGQLIANALGASVSRNQHQELGWMDVGRVSHVPENYFQIPEKINIMQWHSETFEIPRGGVRLAQNNVCQIKCIKLGAMYWVFNFILK